MTTPQRQWHEVMAMMRGYRQAQVLITATRLGVFAQLAHGPQSAAALATRVGADPRALRRLLDAAVGLNLLQKDGGHYENAPLAATCLVPGQDFYLGRLAQREDAFYRRWGGLEKAVRSGERPPENVRDEAEENWVRDFELALYDLARVMGPAVADALALPEERPLRVLDVGGGHGGYSMALARRYPQLSATVYELPEAAEVAREIIASAGMSDRVDVQVGDFQKEELGRGYDLVLLFGVLVSETTAGTEALLRKSHSALEPGGTVAIRSFLLDDERTGPGEAALFSLHMLLSTDAGDLTTESELQRLLSGAGFGSAHPISLPPWTGSTLYVAKKPPAT